MIGKIVEVHVKAVIEFDEEEIALLKAASEYEGLAKYYAENVTSRYTKERWQQFFDKLRATTSEIVRIANDGRDNTLFPNSYKD